MDVASTRLAVRCVLLTYWWSVVHRLSSWCPCACREVLHGTAAGVPPQHAQRAADGHHMRGAPGVTAAVPVLFMHVPRHPWTASSAACRVHQEYGQDSAPSRCVAAPALGGTPASCGVQGSRGSPILLVNRTRCRGSTRPLHAGLACIWWTCICARYLLSVPRPANCSTADPLRSDPVCLQLLQAAPYHKPLHGLPVCACSCCAHSPIHRWSLPYT